MFDLHPGPPTNEAHPLQRSESQTGSRRSRTGRTWACSLASAIDFARKAGAPAGIERRPGSRRERVAVQASLVPSSRAGLPLPGRSGSEHTLVERLPARRDLPPRPQCHLVLADDACEGVGGDPDAGRRPFRTCRPVTVLLERDRASSRSSSRSPSRESRSRACIDASERQTQPRA